MTAPTRCDWPRLIAELEAAGVTLHKQSLLMLQLGCLCRFQQLQRIRSGRQKAVEHFMGECLKQLHDEYATTVPRETGERVVAYAGWTAEQRAKDIARSKANVAVSRGQLQRQPCEKCGSVPAEKHHDDYAKPREIRWLCRKCHMELHQNITIVTSAI